MEFVIREAHETDVAAIRHIMDTAHSAMEKPENFVTDEDDYILASIEEKGIVLLAETESGEPVGYIMLRLPGTDKENLGYDLHMKEEELMQVAVFDSAAVLPEYQGYGLQKRLIAAAEEVLPQSYRVFLATIAPDNLPSLRSAENMGFYKMLELQKYGGRRRNLMRKDRT